MVLMIISFIEDHVNLNFILKYAKIYVNIEFLAKIIFATLHYFKSSKNILDHNHSWSKISWVFYEIDIFDVSNTW